MSDAQSQELARALRDLGHEARKAGLVVSGAGDLFRRLHEVEHELKAAARGKTPEEAQADSACAHLNRTRSKLYVELGTKVLENFQPNELSVPLDAMVRQVLALHRESPAALAEPATEPSLNLVGEQGPSRRATRRQRIRYAAVGLCGILAVVLIVGVVAVRWVDRETEKVANVTGSVDQMPVADAPSGDDISSIHSIASNVKAVVSIEDDDLGGTTLRIDGSTGSALQLEMTNSNPQQLDIGSDLLLHRVSSSKEGEVSVLMQVPTSSEDETGGVARKRAYAMQCDWLLGFDGDQLTLMLFGCNGQAFIMGQSPEYRGKWPTILTGDTPQRLTERIMGETGEIDWVVTPTISNGRGSRFRLLVSVRSGSEATVIPISQSALKTWVCDNQNPQWLREAGIGWLVLETDADAWRDLASILSSTEQDLRIRQACARWLAVAAPPEALVAINQVLWDTAAPNELARTCYYALTWCPHPDAKTLLLKAVGHPDSEIKEDAQTRSKS